jgi:hypothetical protein
MTANNNGSKRVIVNDSTPPVNIAGIKVRIEQLLARIPSVEDTLALDAANVEVLMQWCRKMELVLLDFTLLKDLVSMESDIFPNSSASVSCCA